MATLLTSAASSAMASWPKSLRHTQTCSQDCSGSDGELAVDGMVAPPDNDILSGRFAEMLDYDELLGLMEGVSAALTEVGWRLEPLAAHLARSCAQHGCEEGSKLRRLVARLDGLAVGLKRAAPRLEGVQQVIQQSKFHSARARCEFSIRERARAKQLFCDDQVTALTQRDGTGARQSFTRDEKLARLLARDAAREEFACCTERVERLAGAVLGRKSTTVEAMLTGLSHFVAACSVGVNDLSQELNGASDSMQSHQQQLLRVVVAEDRQPDYCHWPTPTTARTLPSMPVCDFGYSLLAALSSWGCETDCCHRQWQHDSTDRGVDTLSLKGNTVTYPTTHRAASEARLPFSIAGKTVGA